QTRLRPPLRLARHRDANPSRPLASGCRRLPRGLGGPAEAAAQRRRLRPLVAALRERERAMRAAALAAQAPAPLSGLVAEALRANPQLRAARLGVEASAAVAAQRRALPDTQLAVQQLAVGTPVPFAGYANSDFAYIGLGASQEIPFPGKRALRAEVA